MAFGSALRGSAREAGTVKLTADTGEFNAKVEQAERHWRESVAGMSREALKLDLAQQRLKSSLAKYGAESAQAKRATIQLKDAEEAATRAATTNTRATDKQGRELDRLGRGALAGSGLFRGFGRSIAFASSTFLGGAGLTYAIRSSLDAFRESETVLARVQNAVKRAGLQWDEHSAAIDRTIQRQSRLSAFDDEQLYDTFGRLVIRTRDVNKALELNALAANVARGRNISLESATQIVIKASIGQAGALRRLGIDVGKHATATQLLDALQRKYAGNAIRYANSSAGAEARRNKVLQDAQEIIGRGLAPAIDQLNRKAARWLGDTGNQKRLQREVNQAVHEGTEIVHGLAEGLDVVRGAANLLVGPLGGVRNTAKLMIETFAIVKLLQIARGIRGLGLAAQFSRREIALLNATGVAVGPGSVVPIGGGKRTVADRVGDYGKSAAGGAAAGAAASRGGSFLRAARAGLRLGYNAETAVLVEVLLTNGAGFNPGGRSGKYPRARDLVERASSGLPLSVQDREAIKALGQHSFANAPDSVLARVEAILARPPDPSQLGFRGLPTTDVGFRGAVKSPPGRTRRPPRKPRPHEFALPYRLRLAEVQAGATSNESDDLDVYRDELAFVRAEIKAGRLTKDGLIDAYNELDRAQSSIDAILERRRQEAERRRAEVKRTAEAKRRRGTAEQRRETRVDEQRRERGILGRLNRFEGQLVKAQATADNNDDLAVLRSEATYLQSEVKNKKLALAFRQRLERELNAVNRRINTERKRKTGGGLERGAEAAAFVEALSGIARDFASNVSPLGAGASVVVQGDRTHTRLLERIERNVRPSTRPPLFLDGLRAAAFADGVLG